VTVTGFLLFRLPTVRAVHDCADADTARKMRHGCDLRGFPVRPWNLAGFDMARKYALVEGEGKKAIIKINDVGPLTPGRIIDFNERTMRYFGPSLQRGVIDGVKVTPLFGDDWTPGPVV